MCGVAGIGEKGQAERRVGHALQYSVRRPPRSESIARGEGFLSVTEVAVGSRDHELDSSDPVPDHIRKAQGREG
jgi:hypothetical protein